MKPRDREMMIALHLHEQSIHKCGIPTQIGMNEGRARAELTVDDDICFACEMLENHRDSGGETAAGTVTFVRFRDVK